jgi:hypothetical protein
MGGGDVLSYAAQHLDPDGVMFAAIAQNAGTLSLEMEYYHNPPAQGPLFDAFRTIPSVDPFPYVRASSLFYDDVLLSPLLNRDFCAALNLAQTPMQSWIDPADLPHRVRVTDDLEWLMAPTGLHTKHSVPTPQTNHAWHIFDFTAVCDFFEPETLSILSIPDRGDLVVARDGRFYDVWVQRADVGQVGRLWFDLNANVMATHKLVFNNIENISELRVDAVLSGIPPTFDVDIEPDASRPRLLHVDNFNPTGPGPGTVRLNGAPLLPGPTTWAFANGTLTLQTPASAPPVPDRWEIR